MSGGLAACVLWLIASADVRVPESPGDAVVVTADAESFDAGRLRVFVATQEDGPSVLGRVVVTGDEAEFRPRFPWRRGVEYAVVYRPPGDAEPLRRSFTLPLEASGPPSVVAVHPSADELPENVLRFYLHFSRPMRQGRSYRHVGLTRVGVGPVEDPFLELLQELWNPAGDRLTLLIDPGRIKQGLKPREEVGPVFEAGGVYELTVSADWTDADGRPLREPHVKRFRVVGPDAAQPSVAAWRVEPPAAGSTGELAVTFGEPLDHGMLSHAIRVVGSDGAEVAGSVTVAQDGMRWSLRPERPWPAGRYSLRVDGRLEDRAGNSLRSPFEAEMDGGSTAPEGRRFEVPFEVGGGRRE